MRFGYRNYLLNNVSGNVNTPNYGPFTKNYPSIVSNLNNGALNGVKPTPAEFSIMDTGNDYSVARQAYSRVFKTPRIFVSGSVNGKFITPMSSGEIIRLKKFANIGKTSLKQGLPPEEYIANKCYDKNYVDTTRKRVRSSGCVPPKKCGSIYHYQFSRINAFTQNSN